MQALLGAVLLLPVINGLCYTPKLHGFTPDVLLHGLSSEIHCPPPFVFDRFVCLCVDPSVVTVAVPADRRGPLSLSLLSHSTQYHVDHVGLPDMHLPGHAAVTWPSSAMGFIPAASRRISVPALSPYGSMNMPASSNILKAAAKARLMEAALPSKQREMLEKMRWQQQLQQETAAVAAAAMASAASSSALSPVPGGLAYDDFMRDALRRVLYGY